MILEVNSTKHSSNRKFHYFQEKKKIFSNSLYEVNNIKTGEYMETEEHCKKEKP